MKPALSPFGPSETFELKSLNAKGSKPAKTESDLTEAEHAALAAIKHGAHHCDDIAGALGFATGAGALASLGRLARCGLLITVEHAGHVLPRLALTTKGRDLLEGHR